MSVGQKITAVFIVTTIITLVIYDIYIAYKFGVNSTISWVVWTGSIKYPAIPFASGFLCGHLFWRQYNSEGK